MANLLIGDGPIRAGIVGLGDIARVHARSLQAHPQIELVGGADLNDSQRQSFRSDFGVMTVPTHQELLRLEPDVVFVCVPNRVHPELAIAALREGALVLCEKPPAINARFAREMAAAAEEALPLLRRRFPRATGNLIYGLVYRHLLRDYLSYLTRAALGNRVPMAKASWLRGRGVPARGVFTNLAASGGGAGIDLGVHVLDLAWSALGCPLPIWVAAQTSGELVRTAEVMGYGNYDPTLVDVEDTLVGAIGFPGTLLSLEAAFASNIPNLDEEAEVLWAGSRTAFRYPLHTADRNPRDLLPEVTGEQNGFLVDSKLRMPVPPTVQEGYRRQVGHLVNVLHGDEEPIVTPRQGVELMEMVDALYESACNEGRPVIFDRS